MQSALRCTTYFLLAVVILALSVGAFAQGGSGELTGLVTDPTGAVVSGAEVKLTNSATGAVRTTTTNSVGSYTFVALPVVGSYSLEASPKGFKSVKVRNISISVGSVTTNDIRLELGASTEQVTVEGGVQEQVQTSESSLSGLIDRRVWQQLPLETRDQNSFVTLTAGAVQGYVALNASNGSSDRGAAVNGTRSGTGNYLVEGFDNNDQGLGGGGSIGAQTGGANTTISPDAIQEYRVIDHNFSAEFGKAGGFVTDTVLKSGTNQWHGSLFEYNRVQALAANSFFSNASGAKDALVRNQFGGSVGGPIIKDKTFFYFTTEFHRLRTASPLSGTVMTPDFLNFVDSGAFQTFMESDPNGLCMQANEAPCPGQFANEATLGPIFKNSLLQQGVPLCVPGAANCDSTTLSPNGGGPFTGGLTYPVNVFGKVTVPQAQTLDQARYTVKGDHRLGANDTFSGTYSYDNGDSVTQWNGGDSTFGPPLPNHSRAMNAGITWAHTFSATVLNQARIGYVRHTGDFPGDAPSNAAGVPSIVTAFDPFVGAYGNSSGLPQFFTENQFQYKDDLSVTKGKHNLKAGAEYRRTRNGSAFFTQFNGFFLPYGVEDILSDGKFGGDADNAVYGSPYYGSWYYAQASIDPTKTPATRPIYNRGFRANEVGAYFQDDWRIHPRLTLNLGVRWDYFSPPHNNVPGLDSNLFTGSPATPIATASTNPFFPANNTVFAGFATSTFQVRDHEIWNKDTNNFAPRVGFAWDALGTQRFVIRGGFGMAYDRMYNNIFENIRFNPPFFSVATIFFASDQTLPGVYNVPFTGQAAFGDPSNQNTPNPRAIDQNLVTAYYEQANFGFQYEIAKNLVLDTNYVGTWGRKLVGISNLNTFAGRTASVLNPDGTVGDPTRPNPAVGNINLRTNGFNSNYNAFQTTLSKRFSNGLQFNGNYTYSKAMDEISDAFTPRGQTLNPTDSANIGLDYGPADFNVKHRFVLSYSYDLPIFKGNRWLGGWSTSGIVSLQSGVPFSLASTSSTNDANKNGTSNDRLAYTGTAPITSVLTGASPAAGFFDTSKFGRIRAVSQSTLPFDVQCPASVNDGLWCEGPAVGQTARNTLTGPNYQNIDFSIAKKFRITESTSLQFQANFFNLFNRANFAIPSGNFANCLPDSVTFACTGTFGKSTATIGNPRVTQLALRFDF
ncbi:MAG TPA: TonB-dependent receptor [Terriglobales bacterium]|nr:TonB-dependent receptor [Terriglobales bacterium]